MEYGVLHAKEQNIITEIKGGTIFVQWAPASRKPPTFLTLDFLLVKGVQSIGHGTTFGFLKRTLGFLERHEPTIWREFIYSNLAPSATGKNGASVSQPINLDTACKCWFAMGNL